MRSVSHRSKSTKRTATKASSDLVSAKTFFSQRHFNGDVIAARHTLLDSFEAPMFDFHSPSQVPASSYISLSADDFDSNLQGLPLTSSPRGTIDFVPRGEIITTDCGAKHFTIQAVKGRRVQFASKLEEVHYVTYPSEASKRKRWYQQADYTSFKQDVRATIMAISRAQGMLHHLDINEYTVSGLEKSLSLQQVIARKRKAAFHIHSVLRQQTYCNNPTHIRQISEIFTKSSMQCARLRGILDSALLCTLDEIESRTLV